MVPVPRLRVRLVTVGWLVVGWSRGMVERRTGLPLPALLFDRNFGIDPPEVALALFVAFHEGIMLTEIVTYT